ncbi:MAG: hypothetical protein HND58_15005 [Planctomycetota bacterium]|nr:MAG: hypothetical protein HND58_15005 [Planctomycetota bacterium]
MLLVSVAASVWGGSEVCAQGTVEHVDSIELPGTAVDQHGVSFAISGLSGVTWLGGGSYAAVMDNSDKLVLFDLALAADGSVVGLDGVRGLTLGGSGDHEGIAATGAGTVLVSHEGRDDGARVPAGRWRAGADAAGASGVFVAAGESGAGVAVV